MLKKYFNKDELRAFIICFFAVAAAQAITEWNNFFDDFSKQTAISLLSALLKAGFEAFFIVEVLIPANFYIRFPSSIFLNRLLS